jgi:endonuclease/exonuclease/phosphatase (EEP) superfamily protein YafD
MPVPRAIAPRDRRGAEITQWARALGLHLAYVPAMRNGPGLEDRGNAILATRPLADVEAIELPFSRQRRVAVAASIDVAAADGRRRTLRVATAHFDTGLALTRGGPAQLRLRSARTLVSAFHEVDGPVIIGSDLNASWGDDEPAVRLLRRHLPDASSLDRRSTWHGPAATRGRLDYLFARGAGRPVRVRRLSDRFGSDHYPLLAWFDVSSGSD